MYGYGYKPNKLKADDDRSFQMKIVGVSRSEWQSILDALEEWKQTKGRNKDAQRSAVERGVRCMRSLIDGDSDGFELRECPADQVIIRKPTRAEMKIIRELEKSNAVIQGSAKPKQKRRKEENHAKTLAK